MYGTCPLFVYVYWGRWTVFDTVQLPVSHGLISHPLLWVQLAVAFQRDVVRLSVHSQGHTLVPLTHKKKTYFRKAKVGLISAAPHLPFTICGSWTVGWWWGILSNSGTSADNATMECRFFFFSSPICGHMISRAWAFTSCVSSHLLHFPQITSQLRGNRRKGQRASPHACHSQQCPIWKHQLPWRSGPGRESEKKQHTVAKNWNGKSDTIDWDLWSTERGKTSLWVQTINVKVTLPITHLL